MKNIIFTSILSSIALLFGYSDNLNIEDNSSIKSEIENLKEVEIKTEDNTEIQDKNSIKSSQLKNRENEIKNIVEIFNEQIRRANQDQEDILKAINDAKAEIESYK